MRSVFTGAGCLLRGAGMIIRRPKLFWTGAIPPMITSVLFVGALVGLFFGAPTLGGALTAFAEGWDPAVREVLRGVAALLIVAAAVLIVVVAFSSITLLIGGPFYERIAASVERELGGPPEGRAVDVPLARSIGQTIAVVAITALGGAIFFVIGLIPVVGTIAAAVGGAIFGGWMIALELVGQPLAQRGVVSLPARDRVLRGRRLATLGFGVPTFLLLSVPLLAIVVFPAAAAGGVLLARAQTGEPLAAGRGTTSPA